jgi:hypothetical protein
MHGANVRQFNATATNQQQQQAAVDGLMSGRIILSVTP